MRIGDGMFFGARALRGERRGEDGRPAAPGERLTPVSRFGGERVVNTRGEALGVLNDVVIDGGLNRIAYAIVAAGGFMGVGERLHVVPWTALTPGDDGGSYVVDADEARLASAPELQDGRWPEPLEPQWHERVHRQFNAPPYWA